MGKLLHFPNPRKVMREASAWVVAIEEGLTDDERRALEAWLAADPRHSKALARLANVWGALDELGELAKVFPLEQYQPRRARPAALRTAALAAGVAAIAALGWYVVTRSPAPTVPLSTSVMLRDAGDADATGPAADGTAASQRSYETAVGEQLSARLPDGSVVTLNTDTLLDVEYSASARLITMKRGEASFNVTPDAARPFRVLVGTTVVQAVGTLFNVHLDAGDRIEVTVTEGRVRVTADPPPSAREVGDQVSAPAQPEVDVTVAAGELAVFTGTQDELRPIDALEIEAKLAWQQGMLIFRGAPLETVLADVSRYTTVKFTIADDSIRSTRVGGYFRTGDIDALLVALRESFSIEPQRVGNEIILTARE